MDIPSQSLLQIETGGSRVSSIWLACMMHWLQPVGFSSMVLSTLRPWEGGGGGVCERSVDDRQW